MAKNFQDFDKRNGYDYYSDFTKIFENAGKLRDESNILNLLIGAKDIEAEFTRIITKYPECLKAVPILLAVREHEIFCQDKLGAFTYNFDEFNQTTEQYSYFMRETGLFDLLQNHIISNLHDYVTGVEAGLDSNARKNRGGHQMEHFVENYLAENKRWDFAVKTSSSIYAIETNFYTSGGSKLNETARSYKLIAEEAAKIQGFVFIWITDGLGWHSTKNNLRETFDVLKTIYNIADIEAGILNKLLQ